MRRAKIEEQNRYLLRRQHEFRIAADVVAKAWAGLPEVQAIAVIGSVAKPLWKEIPRFSEFRRERIEVWHECGDLDLALWIDSQHRLGELRRARDRALREAYEAGVGMSVANHQVDVFLFEPKSDRYLGRLCSFSQCPKDKPDCLVPGCGAIATVVIFLWCLIMREIQLRDAKASLSAVVDDAMRGKPAVITRHGKRQVVVVSYEEWQRLSNVPTFGRLLMAAPLGEDDLPSRNTSGLRAADL